MAATDYGDCWLGDKKGILPVKVGCCFDGGDDLNGALHVYSFAVVTISIVLNSNKFQNGDILVQADPCTPRK